MPTIIATPGAVDANSFLTRTEANTYFAAHLYASTWNAATDDNKDIALIMGTRAMNSLFQWNGTATNDVQALTWPRNGLLTRNGYALADTVIPTELKNATAEMALAFLTANRLADNQVEAQGISQLKVGPIDLKFKESFEVKQIPDVVKALLVPSWYEGGVAETTYASWSLL